MAKAAKKKKRMSRGILLRAYGGTNIATGLGAAALRHHLYKSKIVPGANDKLENLIRDIKTKRGSGKSLPKRLKILYQGTKGIALRPSTYRNLAAETGESIPETIATMRKFRGALGQQAVLGTAIGAGLYAWGRHKAKKRKKELLG